MAFFPYAVAAWLFAAGLYGIATSRNLIHLVNCLAVVQSSTYILLLTIGYRAGATAPIFYDISLSTPAVDPVVQTMALTDVVVGTVVYALLLAITVQAQKRFGTLDPDTFARLRVVAWLVFRPADCHFLLGSSTAGGN
jgi:multicomponent Na+:H+ antiporter subunit C